MRDNIASLNDTVRAQAETLGLEPILEQAVGIMRSRLRTVQLATLEGLYREMLALSVALAGQCAEPESGPDNAPVENAVFQRRIQQK